jgi:hypothetical protein
MHLYACVCSSTRVYLHPHMVCGLCLCAGWGGGVHACARVRACVWAVYV